MMDWKDTVRCTCTWWNPRPPEEPFARFLPSAGCEVRTHAAGAMRTERESPFIHPRLGVAQLREPFDPSLLDKDVP